MWANKEASGREWNPESIRDENNAPPPPTHTLHGSTVLKLSPSQPVLQPAQGGHTWTHPHLPDRNTEAWGFLSGAKVSQRSTALLRVGFNLVLTDQLCQETQKNEIRGKVRDESFLLHSWTDHLLRADPVPGGDLETERQQSLPSTWGDRRGHGW